MTLRTTEIKIIVPAERTNLITNPSFEVGTTGYTASGAGVSIARVTTQSRRGIAACEITTATNVISGVSASFSLTSGVTYSFSVDVLDVAGQTFYLGTDDGTTQFVSATWTGTGYWKRKYLTFTANNTASWAVYLQRASVASTTKYYTDGWQFEVGAQSTYLDGDMTGFVIGSTDYRWNGTPHASTSWRSGQTRSGGTYVNLTNILSGLMLVGLGMNSISNIAVPSTYGGAFYQNTIPLERPFSIAGNIHTTVASGDVVSLHNQRRTIMNALSPNLTKYKQPLLLEWTELDSASSPVSETLEIKAVYEGGLEGEYKPGFAFNDRVVLNFRQYMPYITQQGEHGTALGFQTSVSNVDYIATRNSSGTWSNISTDFDGIVWALAKGTDGKVYIGGAFSNVGDANGDKIVSWNGTALASLSTGAGNTIYALAVGPDGVLYAGGAFTGLGGASGNYIAKWNGSAWSALGSGMNAQVYALAFGPDGSLYAGGAFTDGGGVAAADYIAKWDGSSWSALLNGTGGTVRAIAVGKDGSVYIGGEFTGLTPSGSGDYIAKWNGTAYVDMGDNFNEKVYAITIGEDGSVYAGGEFTASGSITTNYVAKWNGTSWSSLSYGLSSTVRALATGKDGYVYAGGLFNYVGLTTEPGRYSLPDRQAVWNGSTWMPIDINLAGSTATYAILYDKPTDAIYVGYGYYGTATSATVTAPNAGTTAYPRIKFTGPGTTYQLKNYTTGKAIFFNLTLLAGETAVLDLDPKHVSFVSSFRGNIMNTILPGSDLSWELLPGNNNVSAFMYGSTTAATGISMYYRDQHESLDQAVR